MILLRLLVVLSFAVGAGAANPQTSAPAPAIPKSTCVKPDHYPGRLASEYKNRAWQKDVKEWGECMKRYVADLQAQIEPWVKTANAAIEEYNSATKEFQEELRKANDN